MRPHRVVVVGNGIAGLTASDSLRAAGFDGELTIVGDEHHAPYSRPALSKAALLDGEEMSSHYLPEATHEAIEVLGVSAQGLDTSRKTVTLSDGSNLPYDAVVIATGSRARRLHSGDDSVGELTLRGLDDALALRAEIVSKPSVIVIGGGALGMEIASGCLATGCDVTLVCRDQALVTQLGAHLSSVFLGAARSSGLRIAPSHAIGVRRVDGLAVVTLADGSSVEADLVISAVGDIPNTEWLSSSGLLVDGRLEVDTRGRVAPNVFAAGDVAFFPTKQGLRRMPLWTSAIEQSKVVGSAVVNGDDSGELDFQPYFWTEQFGLSLKASGQLPLVGAPDYVEGDADGGPSLMRWSHEDGSGTAVAIN
jgi:3-phenylpropionate/trans-cinnamate dioxygenase ferredoxin reductase subunit